MKDGCEREEKNEKSVAGRRWMEDLRLEEGVFERKCASASNHEDDSLGHGRRSLELVYFVRAHAPFEMRYWSHSSGTRSNFASGI